MIHKGTAVSISTTNGGLVTGRLDHDYSPTYPVTVVRTDGTYLTIMGYRVRAVVPA